MEDNNDVIVSEAYLKELQEKAKDSEYYRGRVDGLEYVIDTLENILQKGRVNE